MFNQDGSSKRFKDSEVGERPLENKLVNTPLFKNIDLNQVT